MLRNLYTKYESAVKIGLGIFVIWGIMTLLGAGCAIRFVTGLSCPGCGMTRAYLCFLRGDLQGAFDYHPLFWTVPIIALLLLLQSGQFLNWAIDRGLFAEKGRKILKAAVYAALLIFVVVYLWVYVGRLLDPECTLICYDPEMGIYRRIWNLLAGLLYK